MVLLLALEQLLIELQALLELEMVLMLAAQELNPWMRQQVVPLARCRWH